MLRAPLIKALALGAPGKGASMATPRNLSAAAPVPAKAPQKIEVFIDDKPVMVEPGTTVLQVNIDKVQLILFFLILIIVTNKFRLQPWLVWKFLDFVIMNAWLLLATVVCAW